MHDGAQRECKNHNLLFASRNSQRSLRISFVLDGKHLKNFKMFIFSAKKNDKFF